MMMNQTSNVNSTSLVDSVKVSGISIIDNEHIAINLRYDKEGEPPGVSVVVVAITNSSSDTTIDSTMQNSTATSAD
jgi:type III secretory pathway component EscU